MFERGNQIAYIPNHAEGNVRHKDVEYGFVTKVVKDRVFCRFWSKYHLGDLRTIAVSEGCLAKDLCHHISVRPMVVQMHLAEIDKAGLFGSTPIEGVSQ